MGALTDNRKRRFLDLCLPSPPPQPVSSLSSDAPSKKPKIAATPSPPPPAPLLRRYPPAAPLTRPLHGPQRILRTFRLGSAAPDRQLLQKSSERDSEMGGFFSRFLRRKKEESPAGSSGDQRSDEDVGLGLEEYKKLVVGVQEGHSPVEVAPVQPSFSPGVSDLTVVTQEKAAPQAAVVNQLKVEDARQVALEATPRVERQVSIRKVPVYKELYEESARKHDSRLSSLDFEVRLAEKMISGFRLAAEIAEKKPKEDLRGLFTPLTEEEEGEVDYAMRGGRSGQVLVTHEPSNIEITREVLQCLGNGAWLNDEVINLYLELLKEREKRDPKKFLKCHFFNTFFYKKLISGRNGYDYKAVRRWTTQRKIGYGLIECDKIFVPIHKEVHWCLAIIDVKEEKLQYLDSLGGMDKSVLRVLARYFIDEVKDKSDKEVDMTSWKLETIEGLPLQKNGWDCGMFMLKYTDFFSRGLGLCFGQEHMAYFRKRTAKEILRLKAD